MLPDYIIDYNNVLNLIKDANHYGYKTTVIINGEYYHINPETVPEIKKDNNNDNNLPF